MKVCFVHTNTFGKYRKKIRASPRVHLVLYIASLSRCRTRRQRYLEVHCFDSSQTLSEYGVDRCTCLKGLTFVNCNYKLQILRDIYLAE